MSANMELIDELIQNPGRNFPRLLFESSPVTVIEVLSDLILHPDNGYDTTLQCLYVWQDLQNNPYTLSSILEEIQNARDADIVCWCLTLINRLIQYSPDTVKRIRIRRELEELRFEEQLSATSKCLASSEQLQNNIEKFFLLLRPSKCVIHVPPILEASCGVTDADSGTFSSEEDDMMNTNGTKETEKINEEIGHLVSSIESADALELLAKLLRQLKETKQSPSRVLKTLNDNFSKLNDALPNGAVPSPPPSLSSVKNAEIPTAPPQPPNGKQHSGPPAPPPLKLPPLVKSGPPVPPPIFGKSSSTSAKTSRFEVPQALKPRAVPVDGKRLKSLQWTKIPINNLAASIDQSASNVWLKMSCLGSDLLKNLDFGQLDSYFGCEPVAGETQPTGANEKESKAMTISLLCGKRSLSVNVFLKSLKGMVDELITYIRTGQPMDEVGVERLKMLSPLLPTEEEVQTLNNYTGSKEELGTAECFLFKLLAVPDYKLRVESIIMREELGVFISTVEPDLRKLILACQELRQSGIDYAYPKHFKQSSSFDLSQRNAVGFKLASLWKIDELRAIKGGRTLLHLVAQQAEKVNANLDEIGHVDDAAKIAFESLKSEMKTSDDRVNRLSTQVERKNDDFFLEAKRFLEDFKQKLACSNELLAQIESERQQLAVYFCENEKTFSLEECFKIFSNFRNKFLLAANENHQRKEREKRMQEKNVNPGQTATDIQTTRNITVGAIKSPNVNRRSSVIMEQDRDRSSVSPVLSSRRKPSTTRKESSVFDFDQSENDGQANKTNDLSSFMDQALENNRRTSSRFSPMNSPLSRVQEFHETANINNEVDEVKVPISTIDSQVKKINGDIKPTPTQKSTEKPGAKVKSSALINSAMSRGNANGATAAKYSTSRSIELSTSGNIPAKTTANTTDPLYSKATLRRVPLTSTSQIAQKEPTNSTYRKQAISRIRARQSNEPTQKSQNTAPVQPLKPSQIRLNQSRVPPNRSAPTTQSSTTSASSVITRPSTLTKQSSITNTPRGFSSTVSRQSITKDSKETPANRSTMTAVEKRSLFKQNTSLSTTSRPTLIRCGSKEKPRWS